MEQNFSHLIKVISKSCYSECSPDWIMEPDEGFKVPLSEESHVMAFRGIIYAKTKSKIPGAIFEFQMIVDDSFMVSTPSINLNKYIFHPYVYPAPPYNLCIPFEGNNKITGATIIRDNSIKPFMSRVIETLFLSKKICVNLKREVVINMDAKKSYLAAIEKDDLGESLDKFWRDMCL